MRRVPKAALRTAGKGNASTGARLRCCRGGLLGVLVALACLGACGKRGDPLPPLRKTPLPVSGLRLAQRGERLEISCVAPRASVDGVPLTAVQVELLRAEREGDLEAVASRVVLEASPGASVSTFAPLAAPGTTVRVAARVLSQGRASARTPPIGLTVRIPPAPPSGLAASPGPQGVRLAWSAELPPQPAAAASPPPTAPAFAGGFWVYRRAKDGEYGRASTPSPIPERVFEDRAVTTGAELCYQVRAVASLDPLVESLGSDEICLTVRDVTAPAAPAGLGVLAKGGALEVSWSPSSEPDLALYRLYRSAAGAPRERVAEIAPGETTHVDRDVKPGTDYDYRLTAVDRAGNESAPSAPAEGRLP